LSEPVPAVQESDDQRRCYHCGSPLPATLEPGSRCEVCNQHLRYAPEPVERGPAGWCAFHPEAPVTGVCGHCGAFTCTECEVSVRGIRLCERCRERLAIQLSSPVPWEERHSIGRLQAWWRTTVEITVRPARFFDTMDPQREMGSALWFGLAGAAQNSLWPMLFTLMYAAMFVIMLGVAAFAPSGPPSSGPHPVVVFGIGLVASLGMIVLMPVFTLLGYVLMACLQHLALRIVGAGQEHGLTATLKMSLYAMGTGWVGIVPYMGQWAHPFWWTALMVVGATKVHDCSTTRALVMIVPVALVCIAPVVAYVMVLIVAVIAGIFA